MIQAFSFEYRKDAGNIFGARTFEIFLFLNGTLGTFLLGVAVGTFFTGGAFTVDKVSITDAASPAISRWANGWHGLDALAEPMNLLLGVVVFLAARTLGLLYLLMKPDVGEFAAKCRRRLAVTAPAFVLTFVAFVVWMFLKTGYGVDPATGEILAEPFKYLHNMLHVWWIAVVFLLGVALVLAGLSRHFLGKGTRTNFLRGGRRGPCWPYGPYCSVRDSMIRLTMYRPLMSRIPLLSTTALPVFSRLR